MRRNVGIALLAGVVLGMTGYCPADQPSQAKAIVDKAIKALGGEAKLAEFAAATWKGKGTFYGLSAEIAYSLEAAVQPPEQSRLATSGDFNGEKFERVLVVNRDKGWIKQNDTVDEMDKVRLAEEKERLYANWVASVAPLKEKTFNLSPLGEAKVGDRTALGLKVAREGHRDVELYFDSKTGLLVKSATRAKDLQTSKEVSLEVFYSDYKDFGDIKHATKVLVKVDGKKYAEGTTTEFKALAKLADSVFSKP